MLQRLNAEHVASLDLNSLSFLVYVLQELLSLFARQKLKKACY
jgi:hypothetical protein